MVTAISSSDYNYNSGPSSSMGSGSMGGPGRSSIGANDYDNYAGPASAYSRQPETAPVVAPTKAMAGGMSLGGMSLGGGKKDLDALASEDGIVIRAPVKAPVPIAAGICFSSSNMFMQYLCYS